MKPMKQQCYLWNVWHMWIGLPLLAPAMAILQSWWGGLFVLLAGVLAQTYYLKIFPKISHWLGYGSVEDVLARAVTTAKKLSKVMFYTANVCPFCSIVRRRLAELQQTMGFELEEIDVTFRRDLVKEKGFRAVPVVETEGRYLVGTATSAELAAFLTNPNG